MKIHNATTGVIIIADIPGPQGNGLTLQAGADILIFDEDAEKSSQLGSLMTAGAITKLSDEEPADGGPNADADAAGAAADATQALADAATAQAAADAAQTDATQALADAAAAQSTADAAQPVSEKDQPSGYAGLDASTKLAQAQMSGVIASGDLTNDADLEKTANKDAVGGYAGLDGSGKLASSQLPIVVIDSAASSGGSATETMTFTGLLATDTILALTLKAPGSSGGLIGFANQANDALDVSFDVDPGADAVVRAAVLR